MKLASSLLMSLTLALSLAVPALARGAPPPGGMTVVARGLDNPRGIALASDGSIYVAEAGKGGSGPCVKSPEGGQACLGNTGAITRISNGRQARVVTGLPSVAARDGSAASGPSDVAIDDQGRVYATVQGVDSSQPKTFGSAGNTLWSVIRLNGRGGYDRVADLYAYEAQHNPDGREINSDPYALIALSNGEVVADAASNDLLGVDSGGSISTLAVFPTRMVPGPNGKNMPMESVPNAVVVAPDGSYYVGELTGFPFPKGGARVYKVPADGGTPQVYASGFTNIISLALGPDGSLYVLEITKNGLANANPKDPSTLAGELIRIAPDGTRTVVASNGLVVPTGVAVDKDGNIYISNFGILPGRGEVVRISAQPGMPSTGGGGTARSSPTAPASGALATVVGLGACAALLSRKMRGQWNRRRWPS